MSLLKRGLRTTMTGRRPTPNVSATQDRRWRQDGLGALVRLGVLTPDSDPVPESELWAMAPAGVSVHVSRVPWNLQPRERAPAVAREPALTFAAPPHVDGAVELLAAVSPHVILYAFTSSSYVLETGEEEALRARLEPRGGGVPILLTCPAAVSALRVLGAKRVAVVHPPWFSAQMNASGEQYYRARGFEVVFCAPMSPARPFTEVPASEVFDWVRANTPRQADAVFILSQLGREHIVLEHGRIGEAWRSERWDSLMFQFPNWSLQLPQYAYQGDDPEGFAPREDVVRFLESYARFIHAPLRCFIPSTLIS